MSHSQRVCSWSHTIQSLFLPCPLNGILSFSGVRLYLLVLSLCYRFPILESKFTNTGPLFSCFLNLQQNPLHNRHAITTCWMNKHNYIVLVSAALPQVMWPQLPLALRCLKEGKSNLIGIAVSYHSPFISLTPSSKTLTRERCQAEKPRFKEHCAAAWIMGKAPGRGGRIASSYLHFEYKCLTWQLANSTVITQSWKYREARGLSWHCPRQHTMGRGMSLMDPLHQFCLCIGWAAFWS